MCRLHPRNTHMETRNFVRSEHSAATATAGYSRFSGRGGGGGGSGSGSGVPRQLNFSSGSDNVELDQIKEEELERRGIKIEDSDSENYSNVTPREVFDFYQSIGDWQNILPKTDYTYSPASPYHRKKINGNIPVIPNMSRRPLRSSDGSCSGSGSGSGSGSSTNGSFYDVSRDNQINSTIDRRYHRSFSSIEERTFERTRTIQQRRRQQQEQRSTRVVQGSWRGDLLSVRRVTRVIRETYWRTIKRLSLLYSEVVWKDTEGLARSTLGSRRTRTPYVWYFIALFVLLALALALYLLKFSMAGVISEFAEKTCDAFVGIFSFVASLVLNVFELTYSSFCFVLSSVWMLVDTVRVGVSRAATSTTSIPTKPSAVVGHQERTVVTEAVADLQQTLEKWFDEKLDRDAEGIAKKLTITAEFERFIAEKLKTSEEVNRRREAATHDHDSLSSSSSSSSLARKLNALEDKIAEWRTEQAATLKESIGTLRERIARYEQRIEKEVLVFIASVAGETDSVDEARRKFAVLFEFVGEASLKINDLSKQLSEYAKNSSENFHIMERLRMELHDSLKISIDQLISSKLNEWKNEAKIADATKTSSSASAATAAFSHVDELENYVKTMIREALEVYDADKTGQPDFALESQGGTILSTRCTETRTANAQFFIFGIPLWHASRSPRTVIQPGVHPGECWAFPGSTGYLVIQLSEKISITGFTLEHLPKLLSPNGTIDSAPKDFSVWALRWETDPEPRFLGEFRYDENGTSLQYFEAIRLNELYQIVELRILSNHGKMEYTCLYRFRVHGKPATT